jgi:hypothetical protein
MDAASSSTSTTHLPHFAPPRSVCIRERKKEKQVERERERDRNVALRLSPHGPPDPHRLWRCRGASGGCGRTSSGDARPPGN